LALIKLQNEKKLGRSFAGLLALTEGMYKLNCLDESDYQLHVKRYSKGLDENQKSHLTLEQIKAKNEIEEKQKVFSRVLEQWNMHPQKKWRNKWIIEANKWKDKVVNARLVLDLAKETSFDN
jgi:hypothetical protein